MEIGEVYFWTSTIMDWKKLLIKDEYKTVIIDSLKYLTENKLIKVYGFVIMPNHVHLIWEMLKMNGKELPDSSFLKFTAHAFKKDLAVNHPKVLEIFKSDKKGREYNFWKRDAMAIRIFSKEMLMQKLEYIHYNPITGKWNLADSPETYHWSSANYYLNGVDDFGFISHIGELF